MFERAVGVVVVKLLGVRGDRCRGGLGLMLPSFYRSVFPRWLVVG